MTLALEPLRVAALALLAQGPGEVGGVTRRLRHFYHLTIPKKMLLEKLAKELGVEINLP